MTSELKADERQISHFRQQILLAETNHRYDIAETALEHWLSVDGNDPEALFFQAQISILKDDIARAKNEILALEQAHPTYPNLNKLKSLFEAFSNKKIQLKQAHFLADKQRRKEAIALYEELFPFGMPTAEIEVEYLNLISKRSPSDDNKAVKKLQERNKQYSDNPEYKQALANTINNETPNDAESLTTFKRLSGSEQLKGKEAYSWEDVLSGVAINKLTEAEIDDLLNSYPDDESVSATAKKLKIELEKYKKQYKVNSKQVNDHGNKEKLQTAKILPQTKKTGSSGNYYVAPLKKTNNNKFQEAPTERLTGRQKKTGSADNLDDAKIKLLLSDAENALSHNDFIKADEKIKAIESYKTVDPWLNFHIANALNQLDKKPEADRLMDRLLTSTQPTADTYFAVALYFEKQDRLLDALTQFNKIAPAQRSPNIIKNQHRILIDYKFSLLDDLVKNNRPLAVSNLHEIEPELRTDPDQLIRLSNYWLKINEPDQAKRIADSLTINDTWSVGTKLNYGWLNSELKNFDKLDYLQKHINLSSASDEEKNQYRMIMLEYHANKDKQYSAQTNKTTTDPYVIGAQSAENMSDTPALTEEEYSDFPEVKEIQILVQKNQLDEAEKAMKKMLADSTSEDRALYNASQIAFKIKKWDTAEALSYAALQANKANNNVAVDNTMPLSNNEKKQLYMTGNDDWLAKNAKSTIDQLRNKTDSYVTVFPDYRFGTNTDVISTPIEGKLAYNKMGHFIFRINPVSLYTDKTQDLNAKDYGSSLLHCQNSSCSPQQSTLNATGVGYNVGWMGDHWMADVGRTPENFPVTDVIGGLNIDGDIKGFSWGIGGGRRAVRNTVLSYAGLVDPNTGKTWGGARQLGGGIDLGFDNGGPVGVWSNLQYQNITGEHIRDNNKLQGQIGIYGNVWKGKGNIPNVDLGLSTLYMGFDNNQSEFTYGNGGYFSPKSYYSFSLPLTTYGTYSNWSYLVRLSGGYSLTKTNDSNYYPNDPSMQADAIAAGLSPVYLGSNSSSIIYGINTILERRLTENWSLGARAQLQRSPYYNPSNVGLYLKYDFNGLWSSISAPPKIPMIFTDYMDY